MKKLLILLAVLMLVGIGTASACCYKDPCNLQCSKNNAVIQGNVQYLKLGGKNNDVTQSSNQWSSVTGWYNAVVQLDVQGAKVFGKCNDLDQTSTQRAKVKGIKDLVVQFDVQWANVFGCNNDAEQKNNQYAATLPWLDP